MASRITANVYHKARLSSTLSSLAGTEDGHTVAISGRSSVGDGAEGLAVWDAASTATADNATVWGSGTGRWVRVRSDGHFNVRWFGAHPSASAATNTTAIGAAITAATSITGTRKNEIYFPTGRYAVNGSITVPGDSTLNNWLFRGDGWVDGGVAAGNNFGLAQWADPDHVQGSVIVQQSTSADCFVPATGSANSMRFKDIAILGPGSGTTKGVKAADATFTIPESGYGGQPSFDNVLVANFYYGVSMINSVSARKSIGLRIVACEYGLWLANVWDTSYVGLQVEGNNYPIKFVACINVHFYTPLTQANAHGWWFACPTGASVEEISCTGGHFEANGAVNDIFYTTDSGVYGTIGRIAFIATRFTYDVRIIGYHWSFIACRGSGYLYTSNVNGLFVDNDLFASGIEHSAGDGSFVASDNSAFNLPTVVTRLAVTGAPAAPTWTIDNKTTQYNIASSDHTGQATIVLPTLRPSGRKLTVRLYQSAGAGADIAWSGLATSSGLVDCTTPGTSGQRAVLTFESFDGGWHLVSSTGWF